MAKESRNQAKNLKRATLRLIDQIEVLSFSLPVTHVYNPLIYAQASHFDYIERYGATAKEIVMLGMNPGPFGMAQTGVPFGDVTMVREWLGIHKHVGKPPVENPNRPIDGFNCQRSEVSGTRLWGWAKEKFQTPEHFFSRFYVINYCPLCFMEESGRNRTPDKLSVEERKPLLEACDEIFLEMIKILEPKLVIGIGGFAEKRAKIALKSLDIQIGKILHPSPASPHANRGWSKAAEQDLKKCGITI